MTYYVKFLRKPKAVPVRTFTNCVQCGNKIEPGLAACGSLTCHDCRRPYGKAA